MEARDREIVPGRPATLSAEVPPPALPCANCGAELTGPFCSRCGQHVADYHRSVWRFVTDFLDNTFCWDNKLLRTLGPLFRWPGELTREFMAGRRVRYVHPLRLFLFTSAVCLALLHFGIGGDRDDPAPRPGASHDSPAATHPDKDDGGDDDGKRQGRPPDDSPPPIPPEAAAVLAKLGVTVSSSPTPAASPAPSPGGSPTDADIAAIKAKVQSALATKLGDQHAREAVAWGESLGQRMEKKFAAEGMDGLSRQVMEDFWPKLPWMLLAMLPIFALMLRGLYWHGDSFYFLHLVFSLHYHTFLLLFYTAYSWLGALLAGSFLHALVKLGLLVPPVYLFLALRRVYGGSARRTWTKVVLLGGMHLLALLSGLAIIGGTALYAAMR